MKIVDQYWTWINKPENTLEILELGGRVCWKSEDKIGEGSAENLMNKLKDKGHTSVFEHIHPTIKIITDRGVMSELTRHRLASYSVESTRYANYSKNKFDSEITIIRPVWYSWHLIDWVKNEKSDNKNMRNEVGKSLLKRVSAWYDACKKDEHSYLTMIENGASPQEARGVLPNSLKTEIVITANIREWRHIFNLRCDKAAHPQFREIMLDILENFYKEWPVLFKDIAEKYLTVE